jgi:hypothetical protein
MHSVYDSNIFSINIAVSINVQFPDFNEKRIHLTLAVGLHVRNVAVIYRKRS